MMTSQTSRRALLSAVIAAPAVCIAPLLPVSASVPAGFKWKAALAAYRAADAKAEAFRRNRLSPANDRHQRLRERLGVDRGQRVVPSAADAAFAASLTNVRALETAYGDLLGVQMVAGEAIMALPAPDAAALADKFDVFKTETEGAEIPGEWIDALGADIRRLAGRAA